ncbi:hypothetical protein [Paenibacillus woosongensis]|uniref:Uncharacterized protein n=1 Tax=Paenibacillus woosongensis TaxID=307580 RepID=A0A7X2Z2U6_9BACL|nr:hypothetical protein [Paenibacillus woosongensis]MUG46446.1 hypothetical protein [Paenibacillus woosongensis]
MKVLNISYPTPLSEISKKDDNNIDIFIELEDGSTITAVVSTAQNLITRMKEDNVNFVSPPQPDIIVSTLTEENIKKAVDEYAIGDAFWLKLLYVASLDKSVIDMDRINQYLSQLKKLNEELLNGG